MSGRAMKDERRGNKAGAAKNGVKPASSVSGGKSYSGEGSAAAEARAGGGKGKKGTSGSEILDYQTADKR